MAEKKSATSEEPNLVRRLDRNTVAGSSDQMLEIAMSNKEKSHFLFRIGGSAIGVVRGESKFGEWSKLVGNFKAINKEGKTFKAGVAFIPGDGTDIVANKLVDGVDSVNFLFDVYVRYDSSLPTKYGFIVEPVRKASEGDPVDLLFNDVKAIPMLEAKT